MTARTQIALILFAGNLDTASTLDQLLSDFQSGLNSLPIAATQPLAYCYYRRKLTNTDSNDGRIFRVEKTSKPSLTPGTLSGSLGEQISQYLDIVAKDSSDAHAVHVLVGAHGIPSSGFSGFSGFLAALRLVYYFVFRSSYSDWRQLPWRTVVSRLYRRLFLVGQPVVALSSGDTVTELRLDELASALLKLPQDRLAVLVLHTCNMASVEAMASLQCMPFHVACETQLKSVLPIAPWVSFLSSTVNSPETTATNCINSIPKQSVKGTFAANHAQSHSGLLTALNNLGLYSHQQLTSSNAETAANARMAVKTAYDSASILGISVDITTFCENLKSRQDPDFNLYADAVLAEVCIVRKAHISFDEVAGPLGGISVYLPNKELTDHSRLPQAFKDFATHWLTFVDTLNGP